jgi:hypothetical protein
MDAAGVYVWTLVDGEVWSCVVAVGRNSKKVLGSVLQFGQLASDFCDRFVLRAFLG